MFRTSAAKWQVPKDLIPEDAVPDRHTGGVRSPLLSSSTRNTLQWTLRLPGKLAPVYLAFKLRLGAAYEGSKHGPHFAVPVGMGIGDAAKPGKVCRLLPVAECKRAIARQLCHTVLLLEPCRLQHNFGYAHKASD